MPKTPGSEEYTGKYFLTDCEGYRDFVKGKTSERILKALFYLDPKSFDIIVDLGCGRGELIKECRAMGCETIGVDYSEASINIAKNYGTVIRANITKLPFLTESVDKVALLEVIEHLDKEDSQKTIKEIYRILKRVEF